MITQKLAISRKLAQELTEAKFKDAPRVKIGRKDYFDVTRSMHLSGKINLAETILKTHASEPYRSIDEVLGDLQIVLSESWNEFRQVNRSELMGELNVTDLIHEMPRSIQ